MKRKIILTTMTLLPMFALSCGKEKEITSAYITSVHDGDTFRDSNGHIYRLFGVDTPEMSQQFNGFVPTEGVERMYAQFATYTTRELILRKEVSVHTITKDKYSRIVARISIGQKDLASELVKAGFARVAYISIDKGSPYFTNDYEYYKHLLDLQRIAYNNKKGVWNDVERFNLIFPKS